MSRKFNERRVKEWCEGCLSCQKIWSLRGKPGAPGIKAFCDDFLSRYFSGDVPGGRVADVWRSISAYMQANEGRQQLHFATVEAAGDCTVYGSVFQDGVQHNAFMKFSRGDTVCVSVCVFSLFLNHCFRRCSFAKGS